MKKSVWKNPFFLIGFTFISLMIVTSFVYSMMWGNEVRRLYFISVEGVVVESSPISPKWLFPFGTDPQGLDMLGKIIIGAEIYNFNGICDCLLKGILSYPPRFDTGNLSYEVQEIHQWLDRFLPLHPFDDSRLFLAGTCPLGTI